MMKKLLSIAVLILLFVACEPEDTNEITDVRDRFVGEWVCEENSNINGERSFTVDLSYDESDESNILINNFYQMGEATASVGTISTTNEETVSLQAQEVDGLYVQGGGTLVSDSRMDFTYVVDDGVELDSVQAVFIKQ